MRKLKLFFSYYKPYKALFWFDMAAAALSSILSVIFPNLTRELLKTYIPDKNWDVMIQVFGVMFAIYVAQMILNYIRIRWGHYLGVYVENDMRRDCFQHLQTLS
nr:ABC transporter ATP-binding protein [Sphaerochaetaceae bacterium]